MKVLLLKYTDNPEQAITLAAKICYSDKSFEDIAKKIDEKQSTDNFVRMLKSLGHESALEHVNFTFGIEGISRTATHQLVRHRIASYSQQSQRYVSMKNTEFIVPEKIADNEKSFKIYKNCLNKIKQAYDQLIELNIPKEDARYILPNACASNIVVTMNARELLHFFSLRCCSRAQWEIRTLAEKMLALAKNTAPVVFENAGPECIRTVCPEGKMSCGKTKEMRKKYKAGNKITK
ncbi:FAD-dependent thymidylate synthase [bacterium]|nr:FAD-dependent thymidylate synthase [bacterium]